MSVITNKNVEKVD
jgi:hypothetical protein